MTTIANPCHIEKGNKLFLSLQSILPQQANLHIKTKLASVISSGLSKSEGEFLLVQIVKSLGKFHSYTQDLIYLVILPSNCFKFPCKLVKRI